MSADVDGALSGVAEHRLAPEVAASLVTYDGRLALAGAENGLAVAKPGVGA